MKRGLYTYDPEVVESRWRLAKASFRYLARKGLRLYLTGRWCVDIVGNWTRCPACRGTVLALRLIEEAGR